jgi:hypothetical protein
LRCTQSSSALRPHGPEEIDELESRLDEQYERIADDGRLVAAFQAHYAEHPEAKNPSRGERRARMPLKDMYVEVARS